MFASAQGRREFPRRSVHPVAVSFMICAPCLVAAAAMMETEAAALAPAGMMTAALCVGAVDFVLCTGLEKARGRLDILTMPALLLAAGLVLAAVIAEAVNRFAVDIGYAWLALPSLLAMAFSLAAAFREKALGLKFQLCANTLALSALWALAETGKVELPF